MAVDQVDAEEVVEFVVADEDEEGLDVGEEGIGGLG